MTEETVLYAFEAATGVATLTFNRPGVFNALDVTMAEAFEAAVARLRRESRLRAVVLTGAGKAFLAGGDVAAFAADPDQADRVLDLILNAMHPAIIALRALDAPVIAAVNGAAAGAGLSLVLAADLVIAHPAARFVLAYDKLAVTPDCGGSWFLIRRLGRLRAFEMMLTGQSLTADQAVAAGLVNKVSAAESFASDVQEVAVKIASGPTLAFGRFKRLADADLPLAAQLEAERAAFVAATRTEDFRGAVQAFVAKTTPSYRGS